MRTIPAVVIGAGGATAAYEYGVNITDIVKEAVRGITHNATRPSWEPGFGTRQRENISALSGEIESLKRMMREANNQKSVVVVTKGGTSWGVLPYAAVAVGVGYLYLRFIKGWNLGEMLWVSHASLKATTTALQQGIDGLKDYTSKTKEFLKGKLQQLETKQEEHMEKTEQIDGRITEMHGDVDEMRGEIGEVSTNVREVKGAVEEIQDAQQYNSQGIFLLLRVVGELVYNNDFRIGSRQELDKFSQRPPPLMNGAPVRGLESVYELSQPSDRKSGSSGWGHSSAPLAINPPPVITDVTSQADPSPRPVQIGQQLPRVLTRGGGGGGASSGKLLSCKEGIGG